jgi:hypothetical protein
MDFDVLAERDSAGEKIEYGILRGGKDTVFIKAGRGGSYMGDEEKYLRFALFLREKYGASVICSSNPENCRSSAEADESVLREFAAGKCFLFGFSEGAFKAIALAERVCFEKALLVNMPLMINFYRNKERLKALTRTRFAFAFGERDPSFKYMPFLASLDGAELVTLENTGHRISCTPEECALFGKLLME